MMIRKFTLGLAMLTAAGYVCAAPPQGAVPFRTTQEAVRYYESLVGRLAQQVRSMQDENALLSASNAELKQRVTRLESDTRALAEEVAALRKQIAADAEVRKNQLNHLADQLSKPQEPTPQPPSRRPPPPPSQEVEFVEHRVERGTTLTALAKAYGVSVHDIMKANKMKSPNLYAGQKLLIPVPKKP